MTCITDLPDFDGIEIYKQAAEKGLDIMGGEKLTVTDTIVIGLCNRIYELEKEIKQCNK